MEETKSEYNLIKSDDKEFAEAFIKNQFSDHSFKLISENNNLIYKLTEIKANNDVIIQHDISGTFEIKLIRPSKEFILKFGKDEFGYNMTRNCCYYTQVGNHFVTLNAVGDKMSLRKDWCLKLIINEIIKMHYKGIVHNDVKPDNLFYMFKEARINKPGWKYLGLDFKLIDSDMGGLINDKKKITNRFFNYSSEIFTFDDDILGLFLSILLDYKVISNLSLDGFNTTLSSSDIIYLYKVLCKYFATISQGFSSDDSITEIFESKIQGSTKEGGFFKKILLPTISQTFNYKISKLFELQSYSESRKRLLIELENKQYKNLNIILNGNLIEETELLLKFIELNRFEINLIYNNPRSDVYLVTKQQIIDIRVKNDLKDIHILQNKPAYIDAKITYLTYDFNFNL